MSNLATLINPDAAVKQYHLKNKASLYEKCGDKVFIDVEGDCRAAHEALMIQYANKIRRRN